MQAFSLKKYRRYLDSYISPWGQQEDDDVVRPTKPMKSRTVALHVVKKPPKEYGHRVRVNMVELDINQPFMQKKGASMLQMFQAKRCLRRKKENIQDAIDQKTRCQTNSLRTPQGNLLSTSHHTVTQSKKGKLKIESQQYSSHDKHSLPFFFQTRQNLSVTNRQRKIMRIRMINYLLSHFDHSIMQPDQQEYCSEGQQEQEQEVGNFDFSSFKATDLKTYWLGGTEEAIKRFEDCYASLQQEQSKVVEHLKIFSENESRYRLSSLRQIKFINDDREIYRRFIASSRRTIEGLHPILLLNILSYNQGNVLLGLAKVRRVSKIFDIVYKNNAVREFFGAKDFGERMMCAAEQDRFCKRHANFERTMTYYKQMHYTEDIPQNSFKEDLTEAVQFINQIHRRVHRLNNPNMHYFFLVNRFMSRERLVIGLSALSLTLLALIRKEAIVAFSNYLALNPLQRKKEQITKTKLGLVLRVVQDEYYRDSLVVNTKISNYLQEMHQFCFAVFIAQSTSKCLNIAANAMFDFLFYRPRGEQESFFKREVALSDHTFCFNGLQFTFNSSFTQCICTHMSSTLFIQQNMAGYQIPAVLEGTVFGCSHVFRGEDTYVVLICK